MPLRSGSLIRLRKALSNWTRAVREWYPLSAASSAEGRVGFHGGSVNAQLLALDEALLGKQLQHKGKYLVMCLHRQALTDTAERRMVRDLLARVQTQKFTKRKGICAAPANAALGVEALKIADEQHAEIAARGN
jgi:hypothetical protein